MPPSRNTEESAVLDRIDRDILRELQKDARLSFKDLAGRVHLSPNAAAERVRRLQKSGVIVAFRTEISAVAMGRGLAAFIDVKLRADVAADAFESAVARIPGVQHMTLTTGTFDYTLRVGVCDQLDLVRLVEGLRASVPIAETQSRVILRERSFDPAP